MLVAAAYYVAVRAPIRGLGNHDVAGIAYQADLVLAGGLPYRDSIELKQPAAFYLVAFAWALFGRSAPVLHRTCEVWVWLGAAGVMLAAYELYFARPRFERARALALAGFLYVFSAAQFESNYATWMMPPYVWCFAMGLRGLRTGRLWDHLACGAWATVAVLFKLQAFVIGAAMLVAWAAARARRQPGADLRTVLGWLVGAVLGALPLFAWFALHGAAGFLVDGIFPISKAVDYSNRDLGLSWAFIASVVTRHVFWSFPSASSLAILALAAVASRRWRPPAARTEDPWLPQVAFLGFSVAAGGLGGMRFFDHYAAQYLPALALLAAHPEPWRWALRRPWPLRRSACQLPVLVGFLVCMGMAYWEMDRARSMHARKMSSQKTLQRTPAEEAGAWIRDQSLPEETIYCWGWETWSVYFWSKRRAPGRLYKELGEVTEYHQSGLLMPIPALVRHEIHWREGPIADELLRTFETAPPAFLVRARPFFPEVANDPITEAPRLCEIWTRDYVFVARFRHELRGEGDLYVYERKDHHDARDAHRRDPKRRQVPSASSGTPALLSCAGS
jgi:hypothetical protein